MMTTLRFNKDLVKNVSLLSRSLSIPRTRLGVSTIRYHSNQPSTKESGSPVNVHFKGSKPHPLTLDSSPPIGVPLGDHSGLQQNHIWTEAELQDKMANLYHHQPKTVTDHVVHNLMFGLYHTFNFISGYNPINPSVKAIEWRLITLESVAGVPGFVAAGFRHFSSLRSLRRDYGWIPTLLEEAENERMHLMCCLSQFNASFITRSFVIALQGVMVPTLMLVYLVHPKSMHRFVGYLEETACTTYVNIINHVDTPGTHLNKAWGELAAPEIGIGYWKLPKDAKWVDCLKCMMADETHHRDVNHTFANMATDDPNPFLHEHKERALHAWKLTVTGQPAWGHNPNKEEIAKAAEVDSADNVGNRMSKVKKF